MSINISANVITYFLIKQCCTVASRRLKMAVHYKIKFNRCIAIWCVCNPQKIQKCFGLQSLQCAQACSQNQQKPFHSLSTASQSSVAYNRSHSRHCHIVGKVQLLQITLTMALFSSSVSINHDSVTVSKHEQYQDPETEAAKWN